MKPTVAVLLSSYNGEKYIERQLLSILQQEDIEVSIFIRDDGSNDCTIKIIEELKKQYKCIEFVSGENVGFERSFEWLRKNISDYMYYAFADQDDYWYPRKMIEAIKKIEAAQKAHPCLYYSNLRIVHEVTGEEYLLYEGEQEAENILKYPYLFNGFGCSMVWNHALQVLMRKYSNTYGIAQDAFINAIAGFLGVILYDSNTYIDHVIHEKNEGGLTPKSILEKIQKYYIRYFVKKKTLQKKDLCKYLKKYVGISDELIECISNYQLSIRYKIKLLYMFIIMKEFPNNKRMKYLALALFDKL